MTAASKQIIETFESLPDPEKREVLAKLLRIGAKLEYPEIGDDELIAAADSLFRSYDERDGE